MPQKIPDSVCALHRQRETWFDASFERGVMCMMPKSKYPVCFLSRVSTNAEPKVHRGVAQEKQNPIHDYTLEDKSKLPKA